MSDLEQLKEIEKIIGKELKPCHFDRDFIHWDNKGYYLLNSQQQVIGLNLRDYEIGTLECLKNLHNLQNLFRM